jgi:hypothetical protein
MQFHEKLLSLATLESLHLIIMEVRFPASLKRVSLSPDDFSSFAGKIKAHFRCFFSAIKFEILINENFQLIAISAQL